MEIKDRSDSVRICQEHKTTWHTNEVSGHSWPTYKLVKKWTIRDYTGICHTTRTEAAADKWADEHRLYLKRMFKLLSEQSEL